MYDNLVFSDEVKYKIKATPLIQRQSNPSLALFNGSHIVVSGGTQQRHEYEISNVEIYSIKSDEWYTAPSMSCARSEHSSCCLGSYIYVADNNGIERLNISAVLLSRD